MFRNYLKTALRNMRKQKSFTIINISGLALGLACCILILLWVNDEVSFDRFNENSDNLYRVIMEIPFANGQPRTFATLTSSFVPGMQDKYPEIINSARFRYRNWGLKYGETELDENVIGMVDPSFLDMFSYPLIKGDPNTALQEPHSILISEEAVEKYFGDEDPIGKIIEADNQHNLTVTGVIKNFKRNSHIGFDFLSPIKLLESGGETVGEWLPFTYLMYVQLQEGCTLETGNEKAADYLKGIFPEFPGQLFLQPVSDIHLHSNFDYDNVNASDVNYVYIFSIISAFILLIACINFMNLSTARSSKRAKEIGMRKVVGAAKFDLIKQFLGESIIMAGMALILALIIVEILLPEFNNLAGKELAINYFGNGLVLFSLIGIALMTGLIAGSYPALFLSSFKPVKVLKSGRDSDKTGSLFRNVLVVFQFTLSIVLIIGTLVVYNQLDFIRGKKLGYEKDHLAYIILTGSLREHPEVLKNELKKNPGILNVSLTNQLTTRIGSATSGFDWEGSDENEMNFMMNFVSVDYDYLETNRMEMADGRFFSREFASDTVNFVLNETAVNRLNLESPVGKWFKARGKEGVVIGVVRDFHFKSLHTKIEPLMMFLDPSTHSIALAKIRSEKISETVSIMEQTCKALDPDYNFIHGFVDESFNNLYNTEHQIGKIFSYFTFIGIFISCLGLFGLAAFMAERKTKEIGIRKVLGATVRNIILNLSKIFIKWIIAANIIAWPVAYYSMNFWLRNFAYKSDIGIRIFLISAVLSLIVAALTVAYQSIKAAKLNPVVSLRHE